MAVKLVPKKSAKPRLKLTFHLKDGSQLNTEAGDWGWNAERTAMQIYERPIEEVGEDEYPFMIIPINNFYYMECEKEYVTDGEGSEEGEGTASA